MPGVRPGRRWMRGSDSPAEVTSHPSSEFPLLGRHRAKRCFTPNPGDGWVKVKAGLRPLGGGGPGVSMAPFFTSCLIGGLDH